MRSIICAVTIWLVLLSPCLAQDVSVKASITPDRVRVGDTVRYEIRAEVAGTSGLSIPRPQLPPLSHFEIVGTSSTQGFSMGTRGVQGTRSYIYILRATEEGDHTIGPSTLIVSNREWQTNEVDVTVLPQRTPTPSPRTSLTPAESERPDEEPETDDFSPDSSVELVFEAEPEDPYLGEQFILTFTLYHSESLYGEPHWPQMANLIVKELPRAAAKREEFNGRYYLVEEWRWACFATQEGPLDIEPVVLSARTHRYGPTSEFTSNPVTVNVQPLPQPPADADFEGAVGRFDVQMSPDTDSVKTGETFDLDVSVRGEGNIHALGVPTPKVPQWCSINQTREDRSSAVGYGGDPDAVGGTVDVSFLVLPKKAGTLDVRPLEFVYFDPTAERYRTAWTEPVSVRVSPGQAASQATDAAASGLTSIMTATPTFAAPPVVSTTLFWVIQLIPLLLVAVVGVMRLRAIRLAQNPEYARTLRAPAQARRRLKEAEAAVRDDDPERACRLISHAITGYIGMRAGLETRDVPDSLALKTLRDAGVEAELIDDVDDLLSRCEVGRFGGTAVGSVEDLIADARTVLWRLQRSSPGDE